MLSRLELIPSELIFLILDHLSLDRKDVVALGMTSQTLWSHVLEHVAREGIRVGSSRGGSLTGVEIACTGTYLIRLPATFLRGDLAKSSVEIYPGGRTCETRKINWAAFCQYDAVLDDPEETWITAWTSNNPQEAGIRSKFAKRMATELSSACSVTLGSSPHEVWILRNLTTNEYLRFRIYEGPYGSRAFVDHPDVDRLRLDDVLLLRITWTKPSYLYKGRYLGIHYGLWAGNCLDVIPLDRDLVNFQQDGWKDRTGEVVAQAVMVADEILPENLRSLHPVQRPRSRTKRKATSDIEDSIYLHVTKTPRLLTEVSESAQSITARRSTSPIIALQSFFDIFGVLGS
jgi:hypothetical protein